MIVQIKVRDERLPTNLDRRRGLKQQAKHLYCSTPIWREKRLKYRTRRDRDPDTGAAKDDQHFELSFGEVSFFRVLLGLAHLLFVCRNLHHTLTQLRTLHA